MILVLLLLASTLLTAQPIAIRNVTAVDANGKRAVTVVIQGGKIASVTAGRVVPAGVKIVDGGGKFLIPGLWDMHVHLWDKEPMLGIYIAAGVTGIRDMGSDPERTTRLKRDVAAGRILGPRVYTPGPMIDGPGSQLKQAPVIEVRNANEARAAVDTVDNAGQDFIRILSRLSLDSYISIAQRARVRRAVFAGHVPESVSVWEAVDARQKSMEHLSGMALACSPEETKLRRERAEAIEKQDYGALHDIRERTYKTFSQSQASELFSRMVRYGVWQTPALTLRKRMALMDLDRLTAAEELRYIPPVVRTGWKDPRDGLKSATAEQLKGFEADYVFHRKLVSLMQRSGVGILAGTDTGDPYVVPGFSLHDELELLVDAGLTPLEALTTATVNAARYFDQENTQGTIARGKTANLVLLDADPLSDIRNTRRIAAVVLEGRLLDRKQLDALLAGKQAQSGGAGKAPTPAGTKRAVRRKR